LGGEDAPGIGGIIVGAENRGGEKSVGQDCHARFGMEKKMQRQVSFLLFLDEKKQKSHT